MPIAIGDQAPGLPAGCELGAPSVVVFHAPHWDPTSIEQARRYAGVSARLAGEPAVAPALVRNDSELAATFGVSGYSAVFVLDAEGRVSWRHVTGLESLSLPVVAAEAVLEDDEGVTLRRSGWTRREFIATALGTAIALALEPTIARTQTLAPTASPRVFAPGEPQPVTLMVNGKRIALTLEPRVTLLDALREYAGLTGSKKGCDHGQCGACTVHIDGRRVLSCLTLAVMARGKPITTIEGLAATAGGGSEALHPMQRAFIEHDGFQCGYCTSGQIMSAVAVLREPWGSSDDDVREAMSGNICRCGAYPGIVAAVQDVRNARG